MVSPQPSAAEGGEAAPNAEMKPGREKTAVAPQAGAQLPAAFSPKFKFSANNKEHEIPEFLRGVIKDQKTQDYLHDIFTKAYGLGPIKERFQSLRSQHQNLETSYNSVMGQVKEASNAYAKGDLDTVFELLQIQPEKVLQWAVRQAELSQLPPAQRQAYEARRDAEKRAAMVEKNTAKTTQEFEQAQVEHYRQMLDMVLERPDIQAAAQAYDARMQALGKQGNFRALVVQVGRMEHATSGKNLTPLEAAKKALEFVGEIPAMAAQPATAAGAPAQATPAATTQQPKTTLPNLSAGAKPGASPAKKPMRSLDDLKRKYDELTARG